MGTPKDEGTKATGSKSNISAVENNEPRGHSLSFGKVNPNISGDLGREGRVNNVFQNLRKSATAMPMETPHDKANKKVDTAAK